MLTKFDSKSNRVKGLSFHPKRPWILASLHNGVIQMWDYRMGTLFERYEEHEGPVRGVDFHKTQPLFVSGGDDYKIKVWNYKLRRCLFTLLGHLDYIRTVQFHHEHPWLVSASDDQTIRLWNWQSRTCLSVLAGHNHYVMCAQFHPRDELIVSASLDQTVRVWDTSALTRKGSRSAPGSEEVSSTVSSALNRAGRSMTAELFPSGGDAVVKYVLEGHDRGANWAAFHPTQPLIVSGADDRQVKLWRMSDSKAWEMDTLRGHTNNVSCVLFHPRHDLVISNSEDKTIRVWDVQKRVCIQTFRRESDRFWMLAAHPEQNILAAGHDGGMVVFKLERERPAWASSGSGHVLVVRDRYLKLALLGGTPGRSDITLCSMRARAPGTLGTGPRSLTLNIFNPEEDSVLVTFTADNGSYELYTLGATRAMAGGTVPAPAVVGEPLRGSGAAAVFTARNKFVVLDRLLRSLIVKSFAPGDPGKRVKPPYPAADMLFPTTTPGRVLVRQEDRICLFELQSRRLVAELAGVVVKYVVWSPDGSSVALLGKHAVVLCDRELTQICSTSETVRVKGGAWDEHGVFLYATLNHIKYVLPTAAGESGIVRTLDQPVYAVEARGGVLYALDRDTRIKIIPIDATEHTFKLALARKQYEKVLTIIRGAKLCGQAVIAFLQKAGCPEVALLFIEDEATRFDLALQCGNLDIALRAAKALNLEEVWLRLAAEALRQGALDIAETVYHTVKALPRLIMLYHVMGAKEKLAKMVEISKSLGDTQSRFAASILTCNVVERVRTLEAAGQTAMAYVAAAVNGLVEDAERLKGYLESAGLPVPVLKAHYAPLPSFEPMTPLTASRIVRKGIVARVGGGGLDLAAIAAAAAAAAEAGPSVGGAGQAERAALAASAAIAGVEESRHAAEVAKVAAAAASKAAAKAAAGGDEEGGGWGDEADDEDKEGEDEAGGWGDKDEEDLGIPDTVYVAPAPAASHHVVGTAGAFIMPVPGASAASAIVASSSLISDHVAAGSFPTAMQLATRQIGIANFAPLLPGMLQVLLASTVMFPGLPGCEFSPVWLSRAPGVFTPVTLLAVYDKMRGAFSDGRFTEANNTADALFAQAPLVLAETKDEADSIKAMVASATQYKLTVRCIATAKATDQADGVRQVQLAALATHTTLDPAHLLLVLNLAMSTAYKFKNFIHAAGFARRLMEMPEAVNAKNATFLTKVGMPSAPPRAMGRFAHRLCTYPPPPPLQAKKIIQSSETEARNNLVVNYDERTTFSICAESLTPIPRGQPLVRSPYSGATYKPEFIDTLCVIDGMAKVGLETIGLVNLLQIKGGK